MLFVEKIKNGENRFLELKKELPEKLQIAKTAIAFANGAGGEIVVGVDDNKEIIGLTEEQLDDFPDKITTIINDNCSPFIIPDIQKMTIDNKPILIVKIYPGSAKPYFIKKLGRDNGTIIRVGATNKLADNSVFQAMERERNNIFYDEEINYQYPISAFDFNKFHSDFNKYSKKTLTETDYLNLKLIQIEQDKQFLTNGAVLLAGLEDKCIVKCARFKGTDMTIFIDKKEYGGFLYEVVENVIAFIKNHLNLHGQVYEIQRIDEYELSIQAIREAVINAIVHRDYTIERDIKVAIYDDMIEIISPGTLPKTVTIEEIHEGRSEVRNKVIAKIFKEIDFIEEWGRGISKIKTLCKDRGLQAPVFIEKSGFFAVEFPRKISTTVDKVSTTQSKVSATQGEISTTQSKVSSIQGEVSATQGEVSTTQSEVSTTIILKYLQKHKSISRENVINLLSIKKSMAIKIFKKLTQQNILIKKGAARATHYVLNKQGKDEQ